MDAPIYSPATAFVAPVAVPYQLHAGTSSLAELMSAPAAWAVVLKHAPLYKAITSSPQIQPFLTNMTIDSFITYGGLVTQAQIDAIDAELQALPRAAWPRS